MSEIKFTKIQSNFDTPEYIRKKVIGLVKNKYLGYSQPRGIVPLRNAIVEYEKKKGLEINEEQVIVTSGAGGALLNALLFNLKPNDEVIIPTPCWEFYKPYIRIAKGIPVSVKYFEGRKLSSDNIIHSISKKTKFLIINTPENPTGRVLKEDELKELGKIAKEYDISIISDEVYDRIVYDDLKHISIYKFAPERTILINSISKSFSMGGWRIGWLIANEKFIKSILRYKSLRIADCSTISQYAGLVALTSNQECVEDMKKEYEKRRNLLIKRMNKLGWQFIKPEGGVFVFPDVGKDSKKFSSELWGKTKVLVRPSDSKDYLNNIKIFYPAVTESEIEEAFDRIEKIDKV